MRCVRISTTDIRAQTGLQDFVATAPLNLVYVAHGERMKEISPEERRLYASVDAAFAGQNVYLFCASEGLATVFRGAVDYEKLNQAMRLDSRAVRHLRADGGISADLSEGPINSGEACDVTCPAPYAW